MPYQKLWFTYLILMSTTLCADNAHPVVTQFWHGAVDNHTQIARFAGFIMPPQESFDFPDAQTPTGWNLNTLVYQGCMQGLNKSVNRANMAMGTGIDIQTMKDHIQEDTTYLLYGMSRGASAIINFLARYNSSNIKGIVLDSAVADIVGMIDNLQLDVGYTFATSRHAKEQLLKLIFPAYQIGTPSPLENINRIANEDLPIFIVHAENDARVAIVSAWQIYCAFLKAKFTNVYLCELSDGKHGFYTQGKDKDRYLHALHSWYKKYNFNYNPTYADVDLTTLQPSIQEIQQKIDAYEHDQKEIYRSHHKVLELTLQSIAATALGVYTMHNIYSNFSKPAQKEE